MVCEQGHGNGRIGDSIGYHESGKALAERVVVGSGLPDGNLLGLPSFDWTYSNCLIGHHRDISTARSAGILGERYRM